MPTAIAALLGTVIFRKRIAGVFVSIITLSVVLLVRLLVTDAQPLTNGFNGLTDLGNFTIGSVTFDSYSRATYYVVAITLALTLVLTRLLVETRAGLILQAIRDDAGRARYLGFDVPAYQIFFFAVSAAIAGAAGLLYVNVAEFASPTFMDLAFSISMVVWAAVGGRNSILGACIGAIVINMIEAKMSETAIFLEAWRAIVGLLFILVVLFLPRGLAGLANGLVVRFVLPLFGARETTRRRRAEGDPVPLTGEGTDLVAAALTLDGLGVTFSGFPAVSDVSTVIENGELRVLLGANGAGKTTLMDLVSGKTHSTRGRVFLFDRDITNKPEHVIARAGMGRKFQIPTVFREAVGAPQSRGGELPEPRGVRQSLVRVLARDRGAGR